MTQNPTFILEVIREKNKILLSLYEQGSTVHQYEEISIAFQEINNLCSEITNLLNKSNEKGKLGSGISSELKKVGQVLYDQLLTNNVKYKLKNTKIDNLLILLDEGLVQIPWELLYDGTQFLCLKFNIGRNVKTRQALRESSQRTLGFPIKMLILADPIGNLNSARQEASQIEKELDKRRKIINVAKKVTNIDTQYLKKNLRDYDLVHFAGHADYDIKNPSNSGWRLVDGRFTASDIVNMGTSAPLPTIVFSNSCQSAQTEEWVIDKDFEKKIFGLANAFLLAGVRHYIGTFWKIPDSLSLSFAKEFYCQITQGKSIGEAVKNARIKIVEDFGEDMIVWASYILYGDPTIILLESSEKFIPHRLKKTLITKISVGLVVLSIISFGGIGVYRSVKKLPTRNILVYKEFKKTWRMFLEGKNAEIIKICKEILEKDPYYLDVYKRLGNVYDRIGNPDKALNIYFDYLLRSQEKGSKENIANAKVNIGWIYHFKGDFTNAYNYYKEGLDLSKQIGDKLTEAKGYRQLGLWYRDKGNDKKAEDLFFKAAEINKVRVNIYNHRYNLACDYYHIALLYTDRDEYELAKDYYLKSKKVFERLGSLEGQSIYYSNVGEIFFYEKNYDKALEYFFKSLEIDNKFNNKWGVSVDYELIGNLYEKIGNTFDAVNFFASSLKLKEEIGDRVGLADVQYALGSLYIKTGQKAPAIYHLQKSLELYKNMQLPEYGDVVEELKNLGFTKSPKKEDEDSEIAKNIEALEYFARLDSVIKKGKLSQIIKYCEEAIAKDKEFDMIYSSLGGIYYSIGDYNKALKYYFTAKEILERKERIADLAQINYQIGQIYLTKGDVEEAINYYNNAIKLFETNPDRSYVVPCKFGIGCALISLNNFKEAKKQINEIFDIAEELKSKIMSFYGHSGLVIYHSSKGEKELLEKNLEKCVNLSNELSKFLIMPTELRHLNYVLSMLYGIIGNDATAIEYLKKVIKYDKENENKYILYNDYKHIASLYSLNNDLDNAIFYGKKALAIAEDITRDEYIIESLISLADSYTSARNNKLIAFYKHFNKESYDINEIASFLEGKEEPLFYYLLDEASSLYNKAFKIATRNNYDEKEAKILRGIAYIYGQKGETEKALNEYKKVLKILETKKNLDILERDWLIFTYMDIAGLYLSNLKDPDNASYYFDKYITYSKSQNLDQQMIDSSIELLEVYCGNILRSFKGNTDDIFYKKTDSLLKKIRSYKSQKD